VGNDQATLVSALASEPCTFTFIGALHLGSDTTHGPLGIYTPGVYCSTGAMDIDGGATITLSGNGTYIFRSGGALDTTANSVVALNNSSACDIFWTAVGASTFGANSTFIGTDIDDAGITIGNMVSWSGRALSFASTITADTDTITVPACSVPVIPATPSDPTLASGSTHRGGTTHYGCKDPSATNYEYFSASRPSLCIYNSIIAPSALISIPLVLATSTPNFPDTGFAPEKSFLSTNILCQEKSSQK
jgi:hypothetical protein